MNAYLGERTVFVGGFQCVECNVDYPDVPISNNAGTMCLKNPLECEEGTIVFENRWCKKCSKINSSTPVAHDKSLEMNFKSF